jgi:hypothetical protein
MLVDIFMAMAMATKHNWKNYQQEINLDWSSIGGSPCQ